jgi:rhamnosyltransferase
MTLPLNPPVSRAAIYVIYDKHGVIDDYILYQLTDIKRNLSFLLVVATGFLSQDGYKKLEPLADHVIVRENKGFDVEAWKHGLEYVGWQIVSQYDELLLMNDSCFGPLFPFKTVFDEMNSRDVDFWSLNGCPLRPARDWKPPRYGFIPAHLCSNFICLRKTILQSSHFRAYWNALPPIKSFKDAVVKHEFLFTKHFEDRGFISGKFVAEDDLYELTDYPLILMAKELVANRNCPIFKKKSFTHFDEFCAAPARDATRALYAYVRDATDYDVGMIWNHILRVGNLAEIKNALHLNYIVPKDYIVRRRNALIPVALFFHFYYLDAIKETIGYITTMPRHADMYILTDTEEKKDAITWELARTGYRYTVTCGEKRGEGIQAVLSEFRERIAYYDTVCFAHDKEYGSVRPNTRGGELSHVWLENILGSGQFVENVLGKFEEEARLGVLSPPPNRVGWKEDGWGKRFKQTKQALEALRIDVPIEESKPPVAAFGSCVWFRPKALMRLLEKDWEKEAFPDDAIERSFGYVAQHAGYYSGWLMNEGYARKELTSLHYAITSLHTSRFWKLTKPLLLVSEFLKSIRSLYSQLRLRRRLDFTPLGRHD